MTTIKNIKNSKIRLFPLQTKDHGFILYNDLPSSYLLSFLIDKCNFNINQFKIEYVYLFKNYVKDLFNKLDNFEEEYFIFSLENYFHSSEYWYNFLVKVLDKLKENKQKSKILIHSIKTSNIKARKIMQNYDFIEFFISTDLEYFFYELFVKKTDVENISNVIYRNNNWEIIENEITNVDYDLNDYIIGAYYNRYYTNFPKSKDYILSIIDEPKKINNNIYYLQSKEKYRKLLLSQDDRKIMLSTWRGCKYNCSYCYRGVKYKKVRQISLETIKKDLDYLEEVWYRYIYFYDDCFITTNLDRIDEIIELLWNYSFSYWIAARYEVCSNNILEKLSKINISRIQIWLQSISKLSNIESKRWFDIKWFSEVMENFKKKNIKVTLDLILGLPWEWVKDFLKTFEYAIKLKPTSIYINRLFLNPKTELDNNKQKYWIITSGDLWQEKLFHVPNIVESNTFSKKDIVFAQKYVSYYIKKYENILPIILR